LVAALRPDPLLAARALAEPAVPGDERAGTAGDRSALAVIADSPRASAALASLVTGHAVMIAVMAMTPVHLHDHGASLTIIGLTISLHIAGMFALSPLVGWFADRYGRAKGILAGQALLLLSALWTASAGASPARVTIGLVGIGLGWSFSTVSASTLFAEAVPVAERPRVQGVADLLMNFFGAAAGLSSGLIVALIGYGGLGLVAAAAVLPAATVVVARALPAPSRAV
jgi:MFS family permease